MTVENKRVVRGYSFFENSEDDSEPLKVVCVENNKYVIKEWIGVNPEEVFIFWNDSVSDFLRFAGELKQLSSEFLTHDLISLPVQKIDDNTIELL